MESAGWAVERHGSVDLPGSCRACRVCRVWRECFAARVVRLLTAALASPAWSETADRALLADEWLARAVDLPRLPTRRGIARSAAMAGATAVVLAIARDMTTLGEQRAVHGMACLLVSAGAPLAAVQQLAPIPSGHLLRAACATGHLEVARWAARSVPPTPPLVALACDGGSVEVVRWLVDEVRLAPVRSVGRGWLVVSAATRGNLEVVRWLVQQVGDVPALDPTTRAGRPAWRDAAVGRPKWWRAVATTRDISLRSACVAAACAGHLDVVEWLAGVSDVPPQALEVAVERGRLAVADWLERRERPTQTTLRRALGRALRGGSRAGIEWTRARLPEEAVLEEMRGDVPSYMMTACNARDFVLARELWDATGRQPMPPSVRWCNPLCQAVRVGSMPDVLRLRPLVPPGIVPRAALAAAAEAGRVDLLMALHDPAFPDDPIIGAWRTACRFGQVAVLDWLLVAVPAPDLDQCFDQAALAGQLGALTWLARHAPPPPGLGLRALLYGCSAATLDHLSRPGWPGVPAPDACPETVRLCGDEERVETLEWLARRHGVAAVACHLSDDARRLLRW